MHEIGHVVFGGVGSRRISFGGFGFGGQGTVEETVDEADCAVAIGDGRRLRFALKRFGLDAVVDGFNHLEEGAAVGHERCCAAQFFAKRGIVEEEKVAEKQQARRLEIGIAGYEFSQSVERIFVQALRVLNEFVNALLHILGTV